MENQNQPETSFSQIPELHKRHFRSFWPIVIIAVVSALVGGILVFLLFNQGLDEELNSLLPGSNYRQNHKQVKDGEDLSTWQTYRNEEYGFELKYPSNVYTKPEENKSAEELRVRIENYSPSDDMYGLSKNQYYLEIFTGASKEDSDASSCAKDWEEIESIKLISASKVFFGYPNQGGDAGGTRYALCTKVNNKNIYVQVTENSEDLPISKQILSTFKFKDQSDKADPVVWNTYTDSKYDFSFKYPSFDKLLSTSQEDPFKYFLDFVDFQLWVYSKPTIQSLNDWFSKNIDYKDSLIESGAYRVDQIKSFKVIIYTDKDIPEEYFKAKGLGPDGMVYLESPKGNLVIGFSIDGQDNSLYLYNYDGHEGYAKFINDILSSLEFN